MSQSLVRTLESYTMLPFQNFFSRMADFTPQHGAALALLYYCYFFTCSVCSEAAQCLAQSREPSAVGLKKKRIFHVHPHFNSIHMSCLSWFFDGRLKRVSLYNACGEHSIYRRFILVSFFVTVLTTIPEEKC